MRDESEPTGRRRVPVDWDDLEMALTWHSDELQYFLDLRTGTVRWYRPFVFGGEREDLELSEDEADAGLADGTLVCVEPLASSVEYGWMAEFAGSVDDGRLRELLDVALRGRGAFRRFKDVLAGFPRVPLPRRARAGGDARLAGGARHRADHGAAGAGMNSQVRGPDG